MAEANWYVVHTYSGYENNVQANIKKTIENRHLQEEILEVRVPMLELAEIKKGKKEIVQKKLFPGYVLINMVMNDDTWYVVRNTRGVTGFVGPGSKPVPLTAAELKSLGIEVETDSSNDAEEREKPVEMISVDFSEGDLITVVAGPWKGNMASVQHIDYNKQTVTINMEMFGGRDTRLEIGFAEVRKSD